MLTANEVLEMLNISRTTLYRLIDAGKITAYKYARHLRFNRSEIMAYIENSKVQPKGKPVHITVGTKRRSQPSGEVYREGMKWVG